MQTDFVLSGIAKLLSGEISSLDIKPTAMAVGSGTGLVASSDTGLSSELIRKPLTAPGSSITRSGSKSIFRITLYEGEVFGQIGCVGLFNGGTGTGSKATGTITIGGTPGIGNVITISVGGRTLAPYWVASTNTTTVAAGLAAWLSSDGYFSSLFTCVATGSAIAVTAIGYGAGYNQSLVAQVTGGVTCVTTASVSGGTSPDGQLLAVANCNFYKEPGTKLLVEWAVNIKN